MKRILGAPLGDSMPALGLAALTLGYLVLAYGYPERARAFPAKVAWVMLALLALDLVSRTETRLGLAVMRALNPAQAHSKDDSISGWRQLGAVLWLAGFVTGIVLIGILAAAPLYVFAAIRFRGGRGYLTALAAAAGTTLFIYLLFGVVLRLELYPGILFANS